MLNKDSKPSHSDRIKVLLVEDHSLTLKVLREIIESYDDLSIVGEAVNGEEAILLAAKHKPDVVLMDIHLPILSGIAASTMIKVNNPFVAVIALTAGDPCEDEKAMTIAGATAVINKGSVVNALHPAILKAVNRVTV